MKRDGVTLPPPAEVAANAGVLRYLAGRDAPDSVTVELPTESTDTWRLGAHPDVVEWLWTRLNAALPADGRCLLDNGAALVDRGSGLIVALALGTQYAIRLTAPDLAIALDRGYATSHEFRTVSRHLDLAATFGPGWVIGRYGDDEPAWLAATCADVDR